MERSLFVETIRAAVVCSIQKPCPPYAGGTEAVMADCCAILVALPWSYPGLIVALVLAVSILHVSLSSLRAWHDGSVRSAFFPTGHLSTFEIASWERVYGRNGHEAIKVAGLERRARASRFQNRRAEAVEQRRREQTRREVVRGNDVSVRL